jgi:hypothetical protein
MNASLTDAIKEAYATAPASKVIIDTLEISQGLVQPPVYLSQTKTGIDAFDELGVEHTFVASGFRFTLPPSDEDGFKSLNIAIDNINRVASDFITTALTDPTAVTIKYRPYVSDDLSTPAMNPPLVLYLKDVQVTAHQVTGKATFMDMVNKKFPSELYQRVRFPSLG